MLPIDYFSLENVGRKNAKKQIVWELHFGDVFGRLVSGGGNGSEGDCYWKNKWGLN